LAVTIAVLVLLPFVLTASEISLCHVDCVCIFWAITATQEVRCPQSSGLPSGWGNPPDGSSGSWGGSGTSKPAPSPLPGNPLDPETTMARDSARKLAIEKLRGEKVTDLKGVWEANECTNLFLNSPLGRSGASLLGSYVVFRDGTGKKDAQGVDQCATGISAWTTCCQHVSDRAGILIHETMHVGGQREDTNGTTGPDDPPNTSQIKDAVNKACN
jgi:hypothetical protein